MACSAARSLYLLHVIEVVGSQRFDGPSNRRRTAAIMARPVILVPVKLVQSLYVRHQPIPGISQLLQQHSTVGGPVARDRNGVDDPIIVQRVLMIEGRDA